MNASPALRIRVQDSAATSLLGERVSIIERQLDHPWRKNAESGWRERYKEQARRVHHSCPQPVCRTGRS